jgi:glycosyltransferase involved in cell wall biosynthesis
MLALAERLPRDRFTIDFLTLAGSGEYDERARAAGLRVIPLGSPRAPGIGFLQTMRARVAKVGSYVATVRRERYDIVDAWLYPGDVLAIGLRAVTRTPVLISGRRNVDPHDSFGRLSPLVDRITDRLVDAVVANSAAAAEHAIRTHHVDPAKVRVIRNGVERRSLPSADQRIAARERMHVGMDDVVVGCVANYLPVKGHMDLLVAFASVAPDVPRSRLVLVGEGPVRAEMERFIAAEDLTSRVILHGRDVEPHRLYPGFDMVVQASHREGLPNALLEAASFGLPIVATDAGGTREIVVDGATGRLVPIGDASALQAAMRHLMLDIETRERLGLGAYGHVQSAFGMDRFVSEFAATYEELVARSGAGQDTRGPS